jgi:hypothetical protein
MSQQTKLPDEAQFNAFATKLRDFRGTLPKEEQHMFDAMVHSAFKKEGDQSQDVQGYWYVYGAYPGWYGAPVYYGTPWAYSYGYGYPYYW